MFLMLHGNLFSFVEKVALNSLEKI
ncbi:MAG: hypothetical protein QG581_491, partial [Patescibacteria group bacterium]|nr:hypothetical protein [Patescibacteria group bacterium]